jgi:hypothetical protein
LSDLFEGVEGGRVTVENARRNWHTRHDTGARVDYLLSRCLDCRIVVHRDRPLEWANPFASGLVAIHQPAIRLRDQPVFDAEGNALLQQGIGVELRTELKDPPVKHVELAAEPRFFRLSRKAHYRIRSVDLASQRAFPDEPAQGMAIKPSQDATGGLLISHVYGDIHIARQNTVAGRSDANAPDWRQVFADGNGLGDPDNASNRFR